jgi:hypothetical protein
LIPFANLREFAQTGFDAASEVIPFGLCRPQGVLVLFPQLHSALGEFRFEPRPRQLMLPVVLALEQSEGFFGTQLRYAGEVPNSETVENLSAGEFARATAQGTFNFFGR